MLRDVEEGEHPKKVIQYCMAKWGITYRTAKEYVFASGAWEIVEKERKEREKEIERINQ